ncbi:Altered inheritance of mitochondria protein 6 [Scheffersomyces spartinae]|uniref:Altered inheritance of mitochondria protein 6 n=1 Tax=Scheffersomyces spartinae TaxID=45513 RepID=A0A9P7VD66_9ASCO|nr:Altered inheritance of mitochondria protein 6 [Scheffersomyces spartinae]KAG7195637.1 Altered inheritance of mitochondria protein 6 [Scheffersomyces spartinae]
MSDIPPLAQVKLSIVTNKRPVARRACLSCRDKKIKCDGEPISTLSDGRQNKIVTEKVRICSNCKFLGIECVFVQSLRGGRRRKRSLPKGDEPPVKTPKAQSPHDNNTILSSKSHAINTTNSKNDLSSFILDKTIEERHRQKLSSPTLTNSFFLESSSSYPGPSFGIVHSSPNSQPPHQFPPPFYPIPGKRPPGFGTPPLQPPPPSQQNQLLPGGAPPIRQEYSAAYHLQHPGPLVMGQGQGHDHPASSILSPYSSTTIPPQFPPGPPPSHYNPYPVLNYNFKLSSAPQSDMGPKTATNDHEKAKSSSSPDSKLNGWPRDPSKTPAIELESQPSEVDGFKNPPESEIPPSDLVSGYGYPGQHQQQHQQQLQGAIPPQSHQNQPHFHGPTPQPYAGCWSRHHHRHNHFHHHHQMQPGGPPAPAGPFGSHGPPAPPGLFGPHGPPPSMYYGFYPQSLGPPSPNQHHHYYMSRGNASQREDYEYYSTRPELWPPSYPFPQPLPVTNEDTSSSTEPLTKQSLESNGNGSGMSIVNMVASEQSKALEEHDNIVEKARQSDTEAKVKSSIGFINNNTSSPKAVKTGVLQDNGKVTESDKAASNTLISTSSSDSLSMNYDNLNSSAFPPKENTSLTNGTVLLQRSKPEEVLAEKINNNNNNNNKYNNDSLKSTTTSVSSRFELEEFEINVVLSDKELANYDLPPFEDLKKYLKVFYKCINSQSRILMDVNSFLSQIAVRFDSASLHALISCVCELTKVICKEETFKHPIHDESHWLTLVFEYWDNLNDIGMLLSYSLISLTRTIRSSHPKSLEINLKMADLIHENGFIDKVNHLPKVELNKRQLFERSLLTNLLWDFYINHIVFKRLLLKEPFKKISYVGFEDSCKLENFAIDDLHFQHVGHWKDLAKKGDSISDFEVLIYATKRLESILDVELKGADKLESIEEEEEEEEEEENSINKLPIISYKGPKTSIGDRANFVSLTAFVTQLFLTLRDIWIFPFFNQKCELNHIDEVSAHLLRNYDELVISIKAISGEKWATYFQLFDVSLELYELLENLKDEPGIPDDGLYVAALLFGMACSQKFYSSFISFIDDRTIVLSHFGGNTYTLPESFDLREGVRQEFKSEKLDIRIEQLKHYVKSKLQFVSQERSQAYPTELAKVLTTKDGDGVGPVLSSSQIEWLTRDVEPKPLHSHNDYWRTVPMLTALSNGAVSIESDIWYFEEPYLLTRNGGVTHKFSTNEVYVGHNQVYLKPNNTLDSQYLSYLWQILEYTNPKINDEIAVTEASDGHLNSVFYDAPELPMFLWFDCKTNASSTFKYMQLYLKRFFDKGYLTYYDVEQDKIIPGPLILTWTGNLPSFEEVNALGSKRYLFLDAPLIDLEGLKTNWTQYSYVASGSMQGILGNEDFDGAKLSPKFTPNQKSKISGVIKAAHSKGLKTRIWGDISWPKYVATGHWQELLRLGVDLLNVDDVEYAGKIF